jgi:hypothetical protein
MWELNQLTALIAFVGSRTDNADPANSERYADGRGSLKEWRKVGSLIRPDE